MIDRLQRRLGYQFRNIDLLTTALTHRSAGAGNNERLEFLGDAILGFEAADYLYNNASDADEGQLSRMRAHLVKRETLAEIARGLELGQILHLGQGELRSGGQNRDSILADAVEAIIAAVYLDGGLQEARHLVRRLLGERLQNTDSVLQQKDAKTRLQEFLQGRGMTLPVYEVVEITGDQHKQEFLVSCQVDSVEWVAQGKGRSRRKAEQQAAAAFIEHLEGRKA